MPFEALASFPIDAIALQPDGKVLIGFTVSENSKGIARLNDDGTLDDSFYAEVTGGVGALTCLTLQPDGMVLVGGFFNRINNVPRANVARLFPNGDLDPDFNNTDFQAGFVQSVALQPDGRILVAGDLRIEQNGAAVGIARFEPDGTLDGSFSPNLAYRLGFTGLSAMVLQADGNILISGFFNTVDGISRSWMARLKSDGSLDLGFNAVSGVDQRVLAVREQSAGKILIGGSFAGVQSVIRPGIARLESDGRIDESFNSSFVPYPADHREINVWGILVQPDAKILVAATDLPVGSAGAPVQIDLARLNADGSLDTSFSRVQGPASSSSPLGSLALQSDGRVLFSGYFQSLNGEPRKGLARLNPNGSIDRDFIVHITDPTPTNTALVRSIVVQPDDKILVAGWFSAVNGMTNANLARLNSDGTVDSNFDPGSPVGNPGVLGLLLQPDGKVLISGTFSSVKGLNRNRIARLNANGSLDLSFEPNPGSFQAVTAMQLQSDGKVLVAGTVVKAVTQGALARLNADGSLDATFRSCDDLIGPVSSLALQANGDLLFSGSFTVCNDVPRNYVARVAASDGALPVSALFRQGNEFVARFRGRPGSSYTIEASGSLASQIWQKVSDVTAPVNDLGLGVGTIELRDPMAANTQRFYRVIPSAQ